MEEEGKEYKAEHFVYNLYEFYSLESGRRLSFLVCGWKSKLSEAMTLQTRFLLGLSFSAVKNQLISWKLKDGCYLVWVFANKHQGMGSFIQDNTVKSRDYHISMLGMCTCVILNCN